MGLGMPRGPARLRKQREAKKKKATPKEFKLMKPKELKTNTKQEIVGKLPKKFVEAEYIIMEPKLDGFRAIAVKLDASVKLYTSGGVRVVNGPKIKTVLKKLPRSFNGIYDGEFFAKDWNETGSIVKTLTPNHPHRNSLRFRIFDRIQMIEWVKCQGKVTLEERQNHLDLLKRTLIKNIVPSVAIMGGRILRLSKDDVGVNNPARVRLLTESIQKYFRERVALGDEGIVIKLPTSVYSFKKNDDWLKLKPYFEADLKIVDVYEGKGKHKGKLGGCICVGKINGKKMRVRVGGGYKDKQRVKFWRMHQKKKLIGKILEVKHEGLTSNNAVRFPRFFRERWDKSKPN